MSEQIRVLVLTTRRTVARKQVDEMKAEMMLGRASVVELVTVYPPRTTLPVDRVDAVDPSRVPFRPLVPVSGPHAVTWRGSTRAVVRGLRGARKLARRLRPNRAGVDPARALEIACATSPALARRAEASDVVLALDPRAVPAVARLARRAAGPVVVSGAKNVRAAMEAQGLPLPPVPTLGADGDAPSAAGARVELPPPPQPAARTLLIAPANYAGQARGWAESVRRHVPDATAMNAQVGAHPKFPFASDHVIDPRAFRGSLHWRRAWRAFVMEHFSHVIVEAGRPVLGAVTTDGQGHVQELRRAGKTVALLSHGSDARIPSVHAATERWHSYDALGPRARESLERKARRNVDFYNAYDGTVFVSTPGLAAFVPTATWLPLVIDYDEWRSDDPPMRRDLPVVAHVPSSRQKGSHMIDPILTSMHERGLISYRRAEAIPHQEMPTLYRTADIVVEQFGIADYSTAACEAMAAGRVVVSRVADAVRERVRSETGRDLPIVEADPTTLEDVILDLVHDRERAVAVAEQGQQFCLEVHDGRRSARVLQDWLDS